MEDHISPEMIFRDLTFLGDEPDTETKFSAKRVKDFDVMLAEKTPKYLINLFLKGQKIPEFDPIKRDAENAEDIDQRNDLFDDLCCVAFFWWFNIKNTTKPDEQWDLLSRQRLNITRRFSGLLCTLSHPKVKELISIFLKNGHGGLVFQKSFIKHRMFWGDCAKFLDLKSFESWKGDSKENLIDVIALSKDSSFKESATRILVNDSSRYVRRLTFIAIENGRLPNIQGKRDSKGD